MKIKVRKVSERASIHRDLLHHQDKLEWDSKVPVGVGSRGQWQPGPQADMLNQIYFCWLLTWLLAASQCRCCQGSIEIIWANLSTSAADLSALLWCGRLQREGNDKQTHSSKPQPSEIRTSDCGSKMSCRTGSILPAEPFWQKELPCWSSPDLPLLLVPWFLFPWTAQVLQQGSLQETDGLLQHRMSKETPNLKSKRTCHPKQKKT